MDRDDRDASNWSTEPPLRGGLIVPHKKQQETLELMAESLPKLFGSSVVGARNSAAIHGRGLGIDWKR